MGVERVKINYVQIFNSNNPKKILAKHINEINEFLPVTHNWGRLTLRKFRERSSTESNELLGVYITKNKSQLLLS